MRRRQGLGGDFVGLADELLGTLGGDRRAGRAEDDLLDEARRVREEVDTLVGLYERAMGTGSPGPRRRVDRRRAVADDSYAEPRREDRRRKALLFLMLADLL